MKRNLLGLVWLTGEEAGSKPHAVHLIQSLLGKSILQLTIEAVRSLGPERILAVIGAGHERSDDSFAPPGVKWLRGGKTASALAAVDSARDLLAKHPSKNLVVLDARLALLSPRTMRSLFLVHQREKNSLTVAAGPGEIPLFVAKIRDLLAALSGPGRRNRTQGGIDDLIRVMAETGKKTGPYRGRHPGESL